MSLFRALSIFAFAGAALSARAGLLGSTVHVDYLYPDVSTVLENQGNAVVGSGLEYDDILSSVFSLNLEDTNLSLINNLTFTSSFQPGTFNGIRITVESGPTFTSAIYTGGGLAPTSLYVQGGALYMSFLGRDLNPGDLSNIRFTTSDMSTTPGPAAALPFALMALKRRRRGSAAPNRKMIR